MRRLASCAVFPATLVAVVGGAMAALERGVPPSQLVLPGFLATALAVTVLERALPYRRAWNRSQGDLATDAIYLPTLFAVGALLQPAVATLGVAAGGWLSRTLDTDLWPVHAPLLAQLALAAVVVELFDYWAHRAMHASPWLWRLHATHHSAPRLYWLNATRTHPGEMVFRGVANLAPLAVLGARAELLALFAVVGIVVGRFQHGNVDVKLGPLNWIFSMAELHRWHHSRERHEADRNYGNSFIFWDALFGTRYLPRDTEPPEHVGIAGLDAFPRGYLAQLLSPLRWPSIERASATAGRAAPDAVRA